MKNVLDVIPHGVTLLSKNGDIKYFNNYAADRIFSTGGKNITGMSINKYLDCSGMMASLKRSKMKKAIIKEKMVLGNQMYEVNLQSVANEEGVLSSFLLSFYDIDANVY
ncbi:MAG TPA: hypothetical protein DEF04_12795, partial [Clostridiales bacterium]|nr:hypothetical protein [Clostridiales bacterium]